MNHKNEDRMDLGCPVIEVKYEYSEPLGQHQISFYYPGVVEGVFDGQLFRSVGGTFTVCMANRPRI